MSSEETSFFERAKSFIEHLLALRITESERLRYAYGPENMFSQDVSEQKPLRVAVILAIIVHFILLIITFPSWGSQLKPVQNVLILKQLAQPSLLMGGGPPEAPAAPPKPEPVVPKPQPTVVPIPDPTPLAPEPIRKKEIEEVPRVLEEIAADLNIGDITAPPGPPSRGGEGRGREGTGSGPASGAGPGAGDGTGVFEIGSGVTNPILLVQTIPSYTDEAIKAKVQGVVLLQAIIRRDGSVDNFKVLRGLGYGLEEKAIQEIANNWRFRPGTFKGRPVDVLATIEVQFNLR